MGLKKSRMKANDEIISDNLKTGDYIISFNHFNK